MPQAFSDGGNLFDLAKAHQIIFHECFTQAKYEPGLTSEDFRAYPQEDFPFLYILDHSLKNLEVTTFLGERSLLVKCSDWIPYLSRIYFEDGHGLESLLKNLERRFLQERRNQCVN